MNQKTREKLRKLHAMLGSTHEGERNNAYRRIQEMLTKHKKSWNDLLELLRVDDAAPDDPPTDDLDLGVNPLDLLAEVLRKHLHLEDHQYSGIALWIAHTHVFDRFLVSPRLALVSPVPGCGKTVTLALLNALCANPMKTDGISPAAVFRLIDQGVTTVLCDEVDNYDLAANPTFRAVVNSGHRRGGKIIRVIQGEPRSFETFAPLALAAIGILPLPIMHRSLVISMTRADDSRPLERFDETKAAADLGKINRTLGIWARRTELDTDPLIPKELRNRVADNWRPLIAIADACGERWAEQARRAAVTMSTGYHDEDLAVTLLGDIQRIFEARSIDRISSALLVEALLNMSDTWGEWRGIRDDRQPRKLSPGELARLLKPFQIRPRSIWPVRRTAESKSNKGYFKADFQSAWRSFCEGGTPAQPSNIKHLRVA